LNSHQLTKTPSFSDGYCQVLGYQLYYKSFGPETSRETILCLHGGPGSSHGYIIPLKDLAEHGFRVVFFDQLGCGKSEFPKNIALYTIERGVEEVEAVRKTLHLGRVHLMGHSYGGLLALAYALKYQKHLKSLITTGGFASVPLLMKETDKMRNRLPGKIRAVLSKYEDRGDYENPEYLKAVMVFNRKHLCRLTVWPEEVLYDADHANKFVYSAMSGPNDLICTGGIRYWDKTRDLHKIHIPTLATGGKYDEASPLLAKSIHREIKGSKLVIFERSSHLPMWEERDRYIRVLARFLSEVGGKD
jgi:proline iminopeptidase